MKHKTELVTVRPNAVKTWPHFAMLQYLELLPIITKDFQSINAEFIGGILNIYRDAFKIIDKVGRI